MEWLNQNAGLVIGIVLALINIIGWLWSNFNKAYKLKRDNEIFHEQVECHSKQISEMDTRHKEDYKQINGKIDSLTESMSQQVNQQQKVNCAILRDRIIQSYKYYKTNGEKMSALDYENLDELFIEYFSNKGNHLVSKIYKDFKTWNVILELDDEE